MKRVLIVGAGPTGLTAALEFARNGIKPEIVDAKEEPSKLSRAVGILPRSIEILDRTGVGERILREGLKQHLRDCIMLTVYPPFKVAWRSTCCKLGWDTPIWKQPRFMPRPLEMRLSKLQKNTGWNFSL